MISKAKVCIVKDTVFPVVMYGCESWTINTVEHWKIDAFELWCWKRLLRVPWTTRRSNKSILKEINLVYLSEGLMLKLKLQYFGHLMWRTDSLEKTLILWKIEGKKGVTENKIIGWHHRVNGHEFVLTREIVKDREAWHDAIHGVTESRTWLGN